jgi:cystathionine beta-lyase/cystathionine gamma-synthase
LLRSALGKRVVWVDENDTAGVTRALERHSPGAIFFDSLCNARGIAVPDLRAILPAAAAANGEAYAVVDNTCLSATCRPFSWRPAGRGPRLIVFESLTKYGQFGLDRAAAGMIVAPASEAEGLSACREHLGTNIADACVGVIPEPSRAHLERRLYRIGRNALDLAAHVDRVAGESSGIVAGACHPALPTHPAHARVVRLPFAGGFFALEFAPGWDTPEGHAGFIAALMREARRRRVPLIAGASFGFDVTRVYRTAIGANQRPFVRVAAGTEHALALEKLKDAFAAALIHYRPVKHPRRNREQAGGEGREHADLG